MTSDKVIIQMEQSGSASYSNGFAQKLTGVSLDYHSSHPEAHTAMIARAGKDENIFRWKTGNLLPDKDGSFTIVWLGGIAICQDGPHCFELYVNGVKQIVIETGDKTGQLKTDYKAVSGVKLHFEQQLTDMYGDRFGWWYLTLPAEMMKSDLAVELEIRGEEAGSQDWIMVFEYALDNLPKLRIDPVLAKMGEETFQILHVNIDSFAHKGNLQIDGPLDKQMVYDLKSGLNSFLVNVPDVEQATELTVEFYLDSILTHTQVLTVQPVTQRKVFILPYSHNDIGYTHIQTVVIDKQCANIDLALKMAEQTADFPEDAQAKWNLEVIWALEHWWAIASDEDRHRFTEAVHIGQIGLNALYANPLSGLCNLVELNHHFDLAHKVAEWTGKTIETATVTDIPGFVWSLQTAIADNGVKYFSIAPNAGDRTGHIYKGLGDKPFYWVSPCGTKEVLTWVKGASYSLFHREKITTTGISKLMKYLRELDTKDYPYEIVALPYTIGGDNGGPDEGLPAFVQAWNERYASPQLVISTHEQLFKEFEARYGNTLPRMKGDMTPYWEDGALSTAHETTMVRKAADKLIQAEIINSIYYPANYHGQEYYKAWQQVILWDEHTWGAWNSVTEPDLPFVKRQWAIKQSYATESKRLAKELIDKACPESNPIYGHKQMVLHNTKSYPVKEVVCLPTFFLLDDYDDDFSSMLDDIGRQYVLVDFPAGWSNITIPVIAGAGKIDIKDNDRILTVENDNIRITFDDTNATITSLYHKKQQKEYVEQGKALLELVYMQGKYPQKTFFVTNTKHCHYTKGSLFDIWAIKGELEGCKYAVITVILYHHTDQIDIEVSFDKLVIREKESMHLAFPIALENGILRYDSAGAPIRPEADQLPGSCKNFFSPTSYVDVSNEECGMTVALTEAPLIEIGGITAENNWLSTTEPGTAFYSYLLNNYWHTNYKADQEGILHFHFSLLLHGKFDPTEAHCFAQSKRQPIRISRPWNKKLTPMLPLIPPDKPIVVLSAMPVVEKHAWLLHILNTADVQVEWKFRYTGPMEHAAMVYQTTAGRKRLSECIGEISLKPFEQIYLSVEV